MTAAPQDAFSAFRAQTHALVDSGKVTGIATLVWRAGEVVSFDAVGSRGLGGGAPPIERDTLFRIASMTKPVISAAALMLLDDGVLDVAEPISRWLPEAAGLTALREPQAEIDDTVPLERPPTLFDLMTHTAGFAWNTGLDAPITRAVSAAIERRPLIICEPDAFVQRICALPLIQQPGKGWYYSLSTDLLGVLVARASGISLPELLRKRIFEPLGMDDTAFFVPPEKLDRLAAAYTRAKPGEFALHDAAPDSFWARLPLFPSGGAGLVSTIDDYLSFARLLLDRGSRDGRRLLSEQAVALMTTNQLTASQLRPVHPSIEILRGRGFGLGTAVWASGAFGWPGAYSTAWLADPKRRQIALAMTQLYLDPEQAVAGALDTV